ncbi:IclR family transcriptional regulator domain-containing protein [Nakamurella endophytica]|uniref:IclR-ED domain-containing protein n=1 Tax=Nakamurella endophytica TaxID=1748367 RepID=A0A917WEP3_9ACTN|nr:IclR family transcriptional regulator C-terminal domain-containing protein [Nakamurella endophytica]GGM00444.1 hypothetical protein GCM10011594_20620 [Nakamurella endophytica]
MPERLVTALRLVRSVADRPDPTLPVAVGALADAAGTTTSSASRVCAALDALGLLQRAEGYGEYRLGRGAVALSGAAAAPWSAAVDWALTRLAIATRETVCLVAPAPGGPRVVATVPSTWTLHVAARVGQPPDDPGGAVARTLLPGPSRGPVLPRPPGPGGPAGQVLESRGAETCVVAVPVVARDGSRTAAVTVHCPIGRADRVAAVARRLAPAAAQYLSTAGPRPAAPGSAPDHPPPVGGTALDLAAATLAQVCAGRGPVGELAHRLGARPDRVDRVLDVAEAVGLVVRCPDETVAPAWYLQSWHRAVAASVLGPRLDRLLTAAAVEAAATAYVTVRRGMRSVTVAEAFGGGPLSTQSWLGRPAQIVGADGGALLVMDFDDEQITAVLPARPVPTAARTPRDASAFLATVRQARASGRLVLESFGEDGLTSVAAPVRGADGSVAAAACLVGPTDRVAAARPRIDDVADRLAADVSRLLGAPQA